MSRIPAVLAALLLCIAATTIFATPSHACSCAPPKDAATALAGSHTVFEGQVVQSNPENAQAGGPPPLLPGPMLHRFEVTRSWKGEPTGLVTVRTPGSAASCGRNYKKGVAYLIYASMDSDGLLRDTLCTRTRRSSDGLADIAILDAGTTEPAAPNGESPASEPKEAVPSAEAQQDPGLAAAAQEPTGTAAPGQASPRDDEDDLSKAKPGCSLGAATRSPPGKIAWWACTLLLTVAGIRRRRD